MSKDLSKIRNSFVCFQQLSKERTIVIIERNDPFLTRTHRELYSTLMITMIAGPNHDARSMPRKKELPEAMHTQNSVLLIL